MGRNFRRVGWTVLLLSSASFGCHKSAVQHKEAPDPLLVTKPPVEGRAAANHASQLTRTPAPPTAPAGADAPAQ